MSLARLVLRLERLPASTSTFRPPLAPPTRADRPYSSVISTISAPGPSHATTCLPPARLGRSERRADSPLTPRETRRKSLQDHSRPRLLMQCAAYLGSGDVARRAPSGPARCGGTGGRATAGPRCHQRDSGVDRAMWLSARHAKAAPQKCRHRSQGRDEIVEIPAKPAEPHPAQPRPRRRQHFRRRVPACCLRASCGRCSAAKGCRRTAATGATASARPQG